MKKIAKTLIDAKILDRALLVGVLLEASFMLLGHYRPLLALHYGLFGCMMIAGTMGLLYARDVARGYRAGALGGLVIGAACGLAAGDAVFFAAGKSAETAKLAGLARTRIGEQLDLFEKNVFRFCWVTDFPMFERDETTGKIDFSHNPFSMPQGGLEALETKDPLTIKAFQYDIVCNGIELSSGAIRNHRPDIMLKAFAIAGYKAEEVEARALPLASEPLAWAWEAPALALAQAPAPPRPAPRGLAAAPEFPLPFFLRPRKNPMALPFTSLRPSGSRRSDSRPCRRSLC